MPMGASILEGALVAIIVGLNVWATIRVRDQADLPANQRMQHLAVVVLAAVSAGDLGADQFL